MRIRSLRNRILLLLAFLTVPVFFVVFNYYLAQVRAEYARSGANLEATERKFLELVVNESQPLAVLENQLQAEGYESAARNLAIYDAALAAAIRKRSAQVRSLAEAQLQRDRSLQDTNARLISLTGSVRYIHEHHLVDLKKILSRGHPHADYGNAETFTRSGTVSASEVDIIGAAVDIHNAVLELLKFFQVISKKPALPDADIIFEEKFTAFISVVNDFENYSLDAQDGLLVEELLISGQKLKHDFSAVMQSNAETTTLKKSLEENLKQILASISVTRNRISEKYERDGQIVMLVQFLSIILTFMAAAAIASNAFRILGRLRRIVTETQKVQENLSHRITVDGSISTEFGVVFHTFNDLATRIQEQVEELKTARSALELRVEERTSELQQANLSLVNEIQERQQVTTALQSSERRYRSLFENTTDIILSIASDSSRFTLVNPTWSLKLGYQQSESLSMTLPDIIVPDQRQQWLEYLVALDTDTAVEFVEGTLIARDGTELQVEGVATQTCEEGQGAYHFFLHDITEKQQAEAERLRMQKLDSIGILAGGIAHDFNNLLSAVVGNLNLAALICPNEGRLYSRLKDAEIAAYQASDLTRQLLTFSKGGEPIRELADLKVTIQDSVQFVLRGSNVRCDFKLAEDLWPAQVDLRQLSQVLQNLVINADQAMPEGGIITISAVNVRAEETSALPQSGRPHVCISVVDQGVGISKQELTRIFDPYFSTKQSGHGLGLASAHSIVRKHEGWISVTSTLGEGSGFDIYLPAESDGIVVAASDSEQIIPGDGSCILIMDDEESVRNIMTEILELNGYKVKATAGGQEALECFADHLITRNPFALVITDLTVPGDMGGKELAERLHDIEPQLPILVASGYANDQIMANYSDYGFIGVLPKPFRAQTIMAAVSKALVAGRE